MAEKSEGFGRRGRAVKTIVPGGLPGAAPPDPTRKRTIAVALVTVGALAAAGIHFAETSRGSECRPAPPSTPATPGATPAPPAPTVTEAPAVTGGGIGAPDLPPCPPGQRREAHGYYGGGRSYWGWAWSSGSPSRQWSGSSSGATVARLAGSATPSSNHSAAAVSHPSSAVSRGGFGATGAAHGSGGS